MCDDFPRREPGRVRTSGPVYETISSANVLVAFPYLAPLFLTFLIFLTFVFYLSLSFFTYPFRFLLITFVFYLLLFFQLIAACYFLLNLL